MNVVSLFSGIGGFDLGFQRAGMNVIAHAEIDKQASSILERHFSEVENFGDVKNVTKKTINSADLISGGFPCQDLSVAGKRAGLAGERSGQWYEFARIIQELRPRWVVIENVAGLLSSNKGRDMGVIIGTLGEFGYGYAWRVLDAQYFGLAQRRKRVFIVANSTDWSYPAKVLFESESGERGIAPSSGQVAGTLTARAGRDGKAANGQLNKLVVGALCARDYKGVGNQFVREGKVIAFNHQSGGDAQPSPSIDKANTLQSNQQQAVVWHNHQQDNSVRIQSDISPTMSKHWGTGGNNVPFVGARRITPLEAERLQGFPDGWTDKQSDSARYRQLGNAVAVSVAMWIGKRIFSLHADIIKT